MQKSVSLLVTLILLVVATVEGRATEFAEGLSEKERELAVDLLAGVLDQRERLRSGEFLATGTVRILDAKLGELHGDVELYSAFDHDRELLRFDRKQPVRRTLLTDFDGNGMPPLSPDDWRSEEWEARGVFLRDSVTGWHSTVPSTIQVMSNESADIAKLVRPFDVRILGLSVGNAIDTGGTFQQCRDALERRTITGVVADTEHIYRLDMTAGKRGLMTYSIWIDERQGFSPVRMEARWSRGSSHSVSSSVPVSTVATVWQRLGDTWVPESLSATDSANTVESTLVYDLAFTWIAVNESPKEEVLTANALAAGHPARVINTTGGPPVVTEVLNTRKPIESGNSPR